MKWIIKVETDIMDLEHIRGTAKLGDKEKPVVVVVFKLKRPIAPNEAKDAADLLRAYIAEFAKPKETEVVVLSGRGPIWFYGLVQHLVQHTVGALAYFDPKVGGAVIVASHRYDMPEEGQVLSFDEELKSRLVQ